LKRKLKFTQNILKHRFFFLHSVEQ
jgi:hypothetical protein